MTRKLFNLLSALFNPKKCAAVFIALCAAHPASAAEAVFVDWERILRDSQVMKEAASEVTGGFAAREQDLRRLREDILGGREKLQKESLTMSEAEKRDLRAEIERKELEFNRGGRALREDRELAFRDLRRRFARDITAAISEVARDGGYAMVIDSSALLYGMPEADITEAVIARFDEGAPAGDGGEASGGDGG
jgi:outer membrane protein